MNSSAAAARGYSPGVTARERLGSSAVINTAAAAADPSAKSMPFITAVCSLPAIAALAALPVVGIVVSHPSSSDAYAVLGAIIASIVTLMDAQKNKRDLRHSVSVFLGSAFMGSILPGIFYQVALWGQWITEDINRFLTWQVWASAGLISGLQGWAMLHVINGILRKRAVIKGILRKGAADLIRSLDSTDPENPTKPKP